MVPRCVRRALVCAIVPNVGGALTDPFSFAFRKVILLLLALMTNMLPCSSFASIVSNDRFSLDNVLSSPLVREMNWITRRQLEVSLLRGDNIELKL